jgi:hypothetical protein
MLGKFLAIGVFSFQGSGRKLFSHNLDNQIINRITVSFLQYGMTIILLYMFFISRIHLLFKLRHHTLQLSLYASGMIEHNSYLLTYSMEQITS